MVSGGRDMEKYIACIREGSAERAIIDLLLENNRLIFKREDLLEEEVLKCRKGKGFEERYLRKGFLNKITVYRILDSRRERFNAYKDKVDVINVITAPEIEMLIILNEGKYSEFKKFGKKPSDYCKIKLKYGNVKNYEFVKKYFSNIDVLINSIHEYSRITRIRDSEKTIGDLLSY